MSEKIYARLLRLYPSSFRKKYEGEALQLIRDRLRDETGFFRRARLGWDLLIDVTVGLPQAYQNSYAVTEATSLSPNSEGIPSFRVLGKEPLRPGSILVGGTLSLAALGAFVFVMSHPIAYWPSSDSSGPMSPIESVLQRVNQAAPPDSAAIGHQEAAKSASVGASGPQVQPPATAAAPVPTLSTKTKLDAGEPNRVIPSLTQNLNERSVHSERARIPSETLLKRDSRRDYGANGNAPPGRPTAEVLSANRDSPSVIELGQNPIPSGQPKLKNGAGATTVPVAKDASFDSGERQHVIAAAIANLRQYYFDRDVAQKTADALLAYEKSGDDNAGTEGEAFADLLTRQMRDVSHDMHLVVVYSQAPLPEHPPEQTSESLARYRKAMEQENCMLRKVEILPHNIGYLKLDFLPDTSVCQSTAVAAMAQLNNVDAIIFDLRDNTGGFPSMVSLIASYLFDHPEYMHSPRGAPNGESWTRSPVPGNRLANKPVYVLTSASTWSGAEQFSYDLKMLRRATVVGETTRGGAHAGVFHRIDDHFGMGIPEAKAINPFGNADWEGTGVEPDVKVKAENALVTAEKMAESKLQRK